MGVGVGVGAGVGVGVGVGDGDGGKLPLPNSERSRPFVVAQPERLAPATMTVAIANAGSVRRDSSRMVVIAASANGCSSDLFAERTHEVLVADPKNPEFS